MMRDQRSKLVGQVLKATWEKNYEVNKAFIQQTPPFMQTVAKATDCRPCVAVGAGPSRIKNINNLESELYDIIACDKVTPELMNLGITPTYIVALNAAQTDVRKWLEPAVNKSILVMPCGVHPETYEGWRPELVRFINNSLATELNLRIESELGLPTYVIGSNAGTFSYLLGVYTLHNPVAYIGMDFSFKTRGEVMKKYGEMECSMITVDGDHPELTTEQHWIIPFPKEKYNIVEMTDLWKGEEVRYTDLGWWDMVLAFQEWVKVYNEYWGIRTINCTEGGVNYSQYVESMSLQEFNEMLRGKGGETIAESKWDFAKQCDSEL